MNNIQYSVEINAPKERVWQVLWDDRTFREWANIIDEGTYMEGDLQEGGEINFMSASGYGVTSRVEKLTPYKQISFRQLADIKIGADGSLEKRDKQWAGGLESYEIEERDDKIKLSLTQDVPDELLEYFNVKVPEALERIKVLAEAE